MDKGGLGCEHYKQTTLDWAAQWGVDLSPCWKCQPPIEELQDLQHQMDAYAWTIPEPPHDDSLQELLSEMDHMELDSDLRDYCFMDTNESFLEFVNSQSIML